MSAHGASGDDSGQYMGRGSNNAVYLYAWIGAGLPTAKQQH